MLRADGRASRVGRQNSLADAWTETQPNDVEKRIEEWVVSHLDERSAGGEEQVDWHELIEENALLKRNPKRSRSQSRKGADREPWARFRVARRRGVTVLRLRDIGLVRETDLHELAEELADLLNAGPRRVVLNFGNVERLSCQAVGILAETHRRFVAGGDAMLKVCGLQPPVAELFEATGLGRELPVHPDESSAVDTPWPDSLATRRLPVTILQALREGRRIVREQSRKVPEPMYPRSSSGLSRHPVVKQHAPETAQRASAPEDGGLLPEVRLVAMSGRLKGHEILVRRHEFIFGRDPLCHLRSRNATVSRKHASLEQSTGRVVLRDLGSRNGTFLNGRLLRSGAMDVQDGDILQVGPLCFSVIIDTSRCKLPSTEDAISSWLVDDHVANPDERAYGFGDDTPAATEELSEYDDEVGIQAVRYEVVEDVLVVTPLSSHLDEEGTVGPLRAGLYALHERTLPKRIVVDLSRVTHVSSLGIGVLLAHNLRLDRSGGAMRLCALQPRVQAILEEVRLPMLIDVLPGRDEAVLTSWAEEDD